MSDQEQTPAVAPKFDFEAYPDDTCFFERREKIELDSPPAPPKAPAVRTVKKERRRRIDPTTFEKQYCDDELEFMTAMQRYKIHSGKTFPSYGEVLRVALELGYRQVDASVDVAFSLEEIATPLPSV